MNELHNISSSISRLFKGGSINIINGGNGWFIRENPKQEVLLHAAKLTTDRCFVHSNVHFEGISQPTMFDDAGG